MRKSKETFSASADFSAPPAAVWRQLTTKESYRNWFGYPKTEDLVFVDPSFSVGAKLHFKGFPSSMIVTAFRLQRELTFANAAMSCSFLLAASTKGCEVTFTLHRFLNDGPLPTDLESYCTETLIHMALALENLSYDTEPQTLREEPRFRFSEFLQRVFTGYRRPVSAPDAEQNDRIYESLIDNTEMSVTIARRSLAAALVLVLFFFSTIGVALSFERSDIVPSSGLSLFESINVNKIYALQIELGDKKRDLELLLSCQGQRLQNGDYLYSAPPMDNGVPLAQLYVFYDAFGEVRRFGYYDPAESGVPLSQRSRLLEGGGYAPLGYAGLYDVLHPAMTAVEVERAVGTLLSAYTVDKNNVTTVHFGRYVFEDDFFGNPRHGELTIVLDPEAGTVSVDYYAPYDANSPWPLGELSMQLKQQYAGVDEYLADLFSFERATLLVDRKKSEVDAILGMEGAPYEQSEAGDTVTFYYGLRSPAVDESGARYGYTVTFFKDIAVSVQYSNLKLEALAAASPTGEWSNLYIGMPYEGAVETVGLLPSAVFADTTEITYHYGVPVQPSQPEDLREAEGTESGIRYPLSFSFNRATGRVTSVLTYDTAG